MKITFRVLLIHLAFGFTFSATFSGCSNGYKNNPQSYGYFPPLGSKVVIHQPIQVLAGRAGLYLQNGINKAGKHDRLTPFCYIRTINVIDSPRTFEPDTFVIKDSGIETRLITDKRFDWLDQEKPRISFASYSNSAPSDVTVVVTMRLYSPKQPEIYLLECGGAEDHPANAVPPTLLQMRQALGDYISLTDR